MLDQDCVSFMLHQAGRNRLLTGDEEITLARQVQAMMSIQDLPISERPPDWEHTVAMGQRAKDKMVSANLRLVIKVAKKYLRRGLDMPDLIQEGSLGLIRGVEKFDPEKGYKLSTYVHWWIRQGITRAIADKARTIRIPVHVTEQLKKVKQTQRQLHQQLDRTPTIAEVADAVGVPEMKFRELLRVTTRCTSLDAQLTGAKDSDIELGALIAADGLTPADTVFASLQREHIEAILADLKPKERFVICCRFGFETGEAMSLTAIAPYLGVTRERVRQIQNIALRKLRSRINRSGGKDLLAG